MVNKNHRRSYTRQESSLSPDHSTHATSLSTPDTLSSRALLGSISSGLGSATGGSAWAPLDGGYRTTQSGATFSIKFSGQSLIWYGFYDTSFPWTAPGTGPMAFYTIDQVDTFAFPTVPSSVTSQPKSTLSNLPLFETKTLPLGQHLLEVSFLGDSGDVPLTVVNIAVSDQAGSGSSSSPSPSVGGGASSSVASRSASSAVTSAAPSSAVSPSDSASSASPSLSSAPLSSTTAAASTTGSGSASLSQPRPSASVLQASSGATAVAPGASSSDSNFNAPAATTKMSNVGPIAGGIAAGVVVLLVLLLILLFLQRRRKRARDAVAGAALGSSSSLRVNAGGELGRSVGAGSFVPDPFPATRQVDLSPVTVSRPYDDSSSPGVSSEKARMYLEQQMLLSDPLSADWPQPMNAKHRDAGPPEVTQAPSLSHLPGAAARGEPDSPIRAPDLTGSGSASTTSSPRTPAWQSMSQIPTPIPTRTPAPMAVSPPPIGSVPRVMGTVQDEDSGIRLMQHSDTGGFVEVLPPSYTAH